MGVLSPEDQQLKNIAAAMSKLITSLSTGVPKPLTELITLECTLKKRAADLLAYFDRPRTGHGPTETLNGRLEHLRGNTLGFRHSTNYTARSLLEIGGFRPQLHPRLGWPDLLSFRLVIKVMQSEAALTVISSITRPWAPRFLQLLITSRPSWRFWCVRSLWAPTARSATFPSVQNDLWASTGPVRRWRQTCATRQTPTRSGCGGTGSRRLPAACPCLPATEDSNLPRNRCVHRAAQPQIDITKKLF